jgi:hypothetical protein
MVMAALTMRGTLVVVKGAWPKMFTGGSHMATAAQRRMRMRRRKADRAVAKARRVVQGLNKKLRNATKALNKRVSARRKI